MCFIGWGWCDSGVCRRQRCEARDSVLLVVVMRSVWAVFMAMLVVCSEAVISYSDILYRSLLLDN